MLKRQIARALHKKTAWLMSAPMLTIKAINTAGLAAAVHRNGNGFEMTYLDTSDADLPEET